MNLPRLNFLLKGKSRKEFFNTSANSVYAVPLRSTHICLRFATANIAYTQTLGEIKRAIILITYDNNKL